jgi:hypothetical protein
VTVYESEARALHRVEMLKRSGIWPGVIRRADGLFALTYDPGDPPGTERQQ